ncbi:MAG: hypothetical protein VX733_04390 [Candidatus Latescibacterota bacterium]|nr:hypothetical protein [Candidatus Latescibacterota bacterium]
MLASTLIATLLLASGVAAQDFYQYWGDGRAEVSSYKVIQSRYGEHREGYGVMIFVTEDINKETLIKVESSQPESHRIYSMKMNNVLKFTTGIYDYSVMTSVFSAVEPRRGDRPFELQRITHTVQEWCGHVFEEVQFRHGKILGDLNSYFEREGRQHWQFEEPEAFVSEDHLWIQVRELKGDLMEEGDTHGLTILPSLWYFRLRHQDRKLMVATLHKGGVESITVDGEPRPARLWRWQFADYENTVWVDAAYPHRILRWQDSTGDSGHLLESERLPYWGLHDNEHEPLRGQLRIPN